MRLRFPPHPTILHPASYPTTSLESAPGGTRPPRRPLATYPSDHSPSSSSRSAVSAPAWLSTPVGGPCARSITPPLAPLSLPTPSRLRSSPLPSGRLGRCSTSSLIRPTPAAALDSASLHILGERARPGARSTPVASSARRSRVGCKLQSSRRASPTRSSPPKPGRPGQMSQPWLARRNRLLEAVYRR